jgi:peptide/nickel transport system substrate-binding protein
MILAGWSAGTGEPGDSMRSLLMSFDPQAGTGSANRGRYSNPQFDQLIQKGFATVDAAKRAEIFASAAEVVMNDVGLIPIHYQKNTWAAKKGLKVTPRTDEYTFAMSVRP